MSIKRGYTRLRDPTSEPRPASGPNATRPRDSRTLTFDGFRETSHGRFRGDRASFATTVATTRRLAEAGLLQGLLSTPNALTDPEEFADLCAFALDVGLSTC